MTRIIYFLLVLLIAPEVYSNSREDLAVALIPDSLIAGAHSVVRSAEYILDIEDAGHAVFSLHRVVTILDEAGADELTIYVPYDKYRKIKDVHSVTYDYAGHQINKHMGYEMEDYAMVSDALYSDERVRYLKTGGGSYPVTIDLTTTIQIDGVLDYPDWQIQDRGEAVQQTSCTVLAPVSRMVRWKGYHTAIKPEITRDEKTNQTRMYWVASGLRSQIIPAGPYAARSFLPHIDLAPSDFEIDGRQGSLSTWASFAGAIAGMWQDKKALPEDIQAEVRNMVKDARTDHEKVAILYSYLQHNFHYVSIQVGIGGIIPFDAATVHRCRYGDCKALSNYMCAMLDVAGVRSYPVLINSGERAAAIDTTFPANKFDHVILYAVADGEPEWLECTSTSMEPGLLGTFTENRYGLMVAKDGRLMRTPASVAEHSRLLISHDIVAQKDGSAALTGKVAMCGEFRLAGRERLIGGKENDQLSFLFKGIGIKRPEEVALARPADSGGYISIALHGLLSRISDFQNGSKSFLPATRIAHWYENLSADTASKYNLVLGFPDDKREELVYHLPAGEVSLPPDADLDNGLVFFHRQSIKADDNTVTICTELKMKVHTLPHSEIGLMKQSLQQVNKALQQKVVYTASE